MPLAIAPMAAQGLAHPDAEVADGAGRGGRRRPVHPLDDVDALDRGGRRGAPDGVRWFQLYTQADPGRTRELVERAEAAGYRAIVVTVDLPVLGYRERDRRSGFDLAGPAWQLRAPGGPIARGGSTPTGSRSWSSGSPALVGRPRHDPQLVVAAARAQGHHDRRGRAARCRARGRRDRRQQPRRPPARPRRGPDRRARGGRRGGRRSHGGLGRRRRPARPRPRDRAGARGARACSSAGRSSGPSRPAARPASSARWRSCARSSRSTLALLGTPTPADIGRAHVAGGANAESLLSER